MALEWKSKMVWPSDGAGLLTSRGERMMDAAFSHPDSASDRHCEASGILLTM